MVALFAQQARSATMSMDTAANSVDQFPNLRDPSYVPGLSSGISSDDGSGSEDSSRSSGAVSAKPDYSSTWAALSTAHGSATISSHSKNKEETGTLLPSPLDLEFDAHFAIPRPFETVPRLRNENPFRDGEGVSQCWPPLHVVGSDANETET